MRSGTTSKVRSHSSLAWRSACLDSLARSDVDGVKAHRVELFGKRDVIEKDRAVDHHLPLEVFFAGLFGCGSYFLQIAWEEILQVRCCPIFPRASRAAWL